jgi:Tfp pilus assembly protein PilN
MADLFLDIRNRAVRAIVAEQGEIRFQQAYPLDTQESENRNQALSGGQSKLREGELSGIIARIRTESSASIDQAHLILPNVNVTFATHRLPKMPHQEALKLVTRKTADQTKEELPQIGLIPMAIDQNSQTWLSEYIPTDILKDYKKEFDSAKVKLKTVSTIPEATLKTIDHIRESIFNAHAIFEINITYVEVYYVSASALLLHETLEISSDDTVMESKDPERILKRRMFTILDLLYHVNAQYLAANPMTPLEKIWLCGADANIPEMTSTLQDAMDVETFLLNDQPEDPVAGCRFAVLKGFMKACYDGKAVNFMHPDLLRRFPLRKKSGLLIYIATALLAGSFVVVTEYRHAGLQKKVKLLEKAASSQKASKAASDAVAKNIDTVKKLTSNQVVLYPIFRELATNLPEGVYLDSLTLTDKEGKTTLDLSASFRQSGDLGTEKTLTRLMAAVSQSPYLAVSREPVITTTTKDKQTVVTVKLSSEVRARDAAK